MELALRGVIFARQRALLLSYQPSASRARDLDGVGGGGGGPWPAAYRRQEPPGALRVIGVEILPQAASLHKACFRGPSAFMLGNERGGLSRNTGDGRHTS